ncbi:flagellin [Spongiibacter sp. KMU-158]|uniref:Flagellin n=1 Tax=Spongiibacter pelagi TaxID=2760804 RepID=A0A927GVT4_9GAMM|nr:flagellin [Spongiibacter pelagi]MBD2858423.1 flagellin [Spongiibacter pelagi]
MALSINTNIASLNAQRNLQRSQDTLSTSLQRLSTGLRINSAKDDAAGLAISTRFTTQINGLNQAVRNANDGISLAQTGESALDEMTNNMQRIRELAIQSANATNSASDRAALDSEVQQRLAEIDRIASQTSFNGRKVLDGSFGSAAFQIGANVGETIGLDLQTSMRLDSMGSISAATSADLTSAMAGTAATSATAVFDASAAGLLSNFGTNEVSFDVDGITVTLTADYTGDAAQLAADIGSTIGGGYSVAADGNNITITNLTTGSGNAIVVDAYDNDPNNDGASAVADFTGSVVSTDGADAVAAGVTLSDLTIAIGDGDAVSVAAGSYTSTDDLVAAINTALGSDATAEVNDDGTFTINAGSESITFGGTDAATLGLSDATASGNLSAANVTTVDASNEMIRRIDSALSSVSDLRSTFGAVQNRFESTITNLQTISENLSASRGRILDADFASETANLTKAQILQQAGTSVLAQANSLPQAALSLLG